MISSQDMIMFLKETSTIIADVRGNSVEDAMEEMDIIDAECVEIEDSYDEDIMEESDIENPEMEEKSESQSGEKSIGGLLRIGADSLDVFNDYKAGIISKEEYISKLVNVAGSDEVAKAAGGVIISVQKVMASAGITMPIAVPIAFVAAPVLHNVLKNAINTGFDRTIENARYYQSSDELRRSYVADMKETSKELEEFVSQVKRQSAQYEMLKKQDKKVTSSLKNLYDSI